MSAILVASLVGASCRARMLPSGSLWVSTDLSAHDVSKSEGPVSLVLTIRAMNPRPWPVTVHVGGPPWGTGRRLGESVGIGFGYWTLDTLERPLGPSAGSRVGSVYYFRPFGGIYTEYVIRLHADPAGVLPREGVSPGVYLIQPYFAHEPAAPIRLTVRP